MPEHYETKTAYDSRTTRKQNDEHSTGWRPANSNGHGLAWGIHFGSYLICANYKPKDLRDIYKNIDMKSLPSKSNLKNAYDTNKPNIDYNSISNDSYVIFSKQSLAMVVMFVYVIALIHTVGIPIAAILTGFIENDWGAFFDRTTIIMHIIISMICLACRLALKKQWIKPKIRAILFRTTGLVYIFPEKGGKAMIKPFTEFNAFINSRASPNSGALYYSLFLSHYQDKDLWFSFFDETPVKQVVFMEWEMVQQFMDISKPLPDIPELEPYRSLDPVTVEWDKAHQRPPKLFENMSDKTFKQYESKLWKYEKGFPWGASRELAKSNGWVPPPDEFWKMPIDDAQDKSGG